MNPTSARRIYLLGAAALAITVGIVIAFRIWSWDDPPIVSAFEWTPSGTGIEVAGLFFALGFITFFRALSLNQPRGGTRQILPGVVFGLASVAAAGLAISGIVYGADFITTPFWDYFDNAITVYLSYGGSMLVGGLILMWVAAILAALSNELLIGGPTAASTRELIRWSSGLMSGLLSPAFLALGIAIMTSDPQSGDSPSLVLPYVLSAFGLTLIFALAAWLAFRPRSSRLR